jgi:chitinase
LTIAASAGFSHYSLLPLSDIANTIDYFNLIRYDYAGSWDTNSGHRANLYKSSSNPTATKFSIHDAIKSYLSAGIPASKIILGIPIYGRSFENTADLGKSHNGSSAGTWKPGVRDYKSLLKAGATEYYDSEACAAYSYDPSIQELISYDIMINVQKKATAMNGKNTNVPLSPYGYVQVYAGPIVPCMHAVGVRLCIWAE